MRRVRKLTTALAMFGVLTVAGAFAATPALASAPEKPVTEAASGVTSKTATLHGELNPGASATVGYYFAYDTNGTCVGGGSSESAEATGKNVKVSAPLTGLEPSKEYKFCLVATHTEGETTESTSGTALSFKTLAAKPEVYEARESAYSVTASEARFEAVINPNNQATTYAFEYAKKATGQTLEGTIRTVDGESPIPASEFGERGVGVSTGEVLEAGETYYYRVVATNATGTVKGEVEQFSKPPRIEGEGVSGLSATGAKLEGTINPDFQETTYSFEYATSEAALGTPQATKVSGAAALPAEFSGLAVSAEISDLQPFEVYYYRLLAENETTAKAGKPVEGPIQSFQALAEPFVSTGAAQNVTRTTATFSGTVNPGGAQTSYYFAYISEVGYRAALAKGAANPYAEGERTTPTSAGASYEAQAVGPALAGEMLPDTTYHYALIASNSVGQTIGQDETLTTSAPTAPIVATGGASGVSQNSATLSGSVDTNGLQTNYGFEIGTEAGNYGPATGLGAIGGATVDAVEVILGELQPGTTYYYRVTASNADGVSYGEPQSFATPSFPTLIASPASPPLLASANTAFPTETKNTQTPTIAILKHSVKGTTATLEVKVPSAGKLLATGKGVSRGAATAGRAGEVTLKVTVTKGEQAFLAKHKGRKLRASVKVIFSPTNGSQLSATTTVLIG